MARMTLAMMLYYPWLAGLHNDRKSFLVKLSGWHFDSHLPFLLSLFLFLSLYLSLHTCSLVS